MASKSYIVTGEQKRKRLDLFVGEMDELLSRSFIQKLIKEGYILVNQSPSKANYLVNEDDEILINVPEDKSLDLSPVDMQLDIIYEDSDVLVVNKPKGLVVHPGAGTYQPTMVHGLLAQIDDLSGINGVLRPGIVHRIDKDTSGLIIVAKHDMAHQALASQLADRSLKRSYIALVDGVMAAEHGKIDAPIGRDKRDRKRMAITDINSKEAITRFKVVKRYHNYTLVECQLDTGRTHQIRVHMQYIGHPIVGDLKYNRKSDKALGGQFLHAYKISFILPSNGELKTLEVALPEDFKAILERIESEDGN